jgi:hypothetical protein
MPWNESRGGRAPARSMPRARLDAAMRRSAGGSRANTAARALSAAAGDWSPCAKNDTRRATRPECGRGRHRMSSWTCCRRRPGTHRELQAAGSGRARGEDMTCTRRDIGKGRKAALFEGCHAASYEQIQPPRPPTVHARTRRPALLSIVVRARSSQAVEAAACCRPAEQNGFQPTGRRANEREGAAAKAPAMGSAPGSSLEAACALPIEAAASVFSAQLRGGVAGAAAFFSRACLRLRRPFARAQCA